MAMLLITHNFGVVARMADDVAVMYGGRLVEKGPIRTVFRRMRHPYTGALFNSIPNIKSQPHSGLKTIAGQPAIVTEQSKGCAFAPRCPRAQEHCLNEDPPLESNLVEAHSWACFHPTEAPNRVEVPVDGESGIPT
jgi:peptide/nickel transport system ATP-binding protein